jgi:uncharacterized protein YjbI with pentapeptide repeats
MTSNEPTTTSPASLPFFLGTYTISVQEVNGVGGPAWNVPANYTDPYYGPVQAGLVMFSPFQDLRAAGASDMFSFYSLPGTVITVAPKGESPEPVTACIIGCPAGYLTLVNHYVIDAFIAQEQGAALPFFPQTGKYPTNFTGTVSQVSVVLLAQFAKNIAFLGLFQNDNAIPPVLGGDIEAALGNVDLTCQTCGIQFLANGEGSWSGADLTSVDLRGSAKVIATLTGSNANWSDANFTGTDFSGVDLSAITQLSGVNLTTAKLSGTTFGSGVDFTGASFGANDLSGAVLPSNPNFTSADLANVIFANGLDLTAATFTGVNLASVDLTQVTLSSSPDFTNANLSNVTFADGLDLSGASLTGVNLSGVDLSQVTLSSSVDFTNANLSGVTFADGVDLTGATFIGANLSNVDLSQVQLPAKVDFTNATLTNTIFEGLTLDGATLTGAATTGASFNGASLDGVAFTNLLLYGAHFEGANLANTTWSSAYCGSKGVVCTLASPASGDVTALNDNTLPGDLATLLTNNQIDPTGMTVTTRIASSDWLLTTEASTVYYLVAQPSGALVVLNNTESTAVFDGAFLNGAVLDNGNFAQVSFKNIVWMGDSATGVADFEGADFSGAIVASATEQYPTFVGAKLFGTQFDNAMLVNANLQGAGFSADGTYRTSLSQANLFQTGLAGADLQRADLTGAIMAVAATGGSPAFYGAPLFVLASDLESDLVAGPAPQSILTAFTNAGYPLARGTIAVTTPSSPPAPATQWTISTMPPSWVAPNPWVIWYKFTILLAGDDLIVYGTEFELFAPVYSGASPNTNSTTFVASAPAMTPTGRPVWLQCEDMSPGTTCPNGASWSEEGGNTWDLDMVPLSQKNAEETAGS